MFEFRKKVSRFRFEFSKKVCIMSNEIEMNISINVTMCPRPERNTGVPEGLKTWWGQCVKVIFTFNRSLKNLIRGKKGKLHHTWLGQVPMTPYIPAAPTQPNLSLSTQNQ